MELSELFALADCEEIKIDFFRMRQLIAFSTQNEIILNPDRLNNSRELKVCLGHELGHHYKDVFYDIRSTFETRGRQEERATRWAVETLISKEQLDAAAAAGYTEVWQLAEYFEVTEDFIRDVIRVYALENGF